MPDLEIRPLTHIGPHLIAALMDEEEQAWMSELNWDYSPIRRILTSFLQQKLLPGFAAVAEGRAQGYTYFLSYQRKGIIGNAYVTGPDPASDMARGLLQPAITTLQTNHTIARIEAQIMPLRGLNLEPAFAGFGFQTFARSYMELDLQTFEHNASETLLNGLVPWEQQYIERLAEVIVDSYAGHIDALICEDYCSAKTCEGYIRSLVENPGCGVFQADMSFVAIEDLGHPVGFVTGSQISRSAAMIPQIAIRRSYQNRGIGSALMNRALCEFKSRGYRTVSLTVTNDNRRAFEWYRRIGFEVRKQFNAYVWKR